VGLIEGDKNRHGAIPFQPFDNDSSDVVWANSGATSTRELKREKLSSFEAIGSPSPFGRGGLPQPFQRACVIQGIRSVSSRAFLTALLVRDRTRERVF
jgi:hypothetical protein